MFLVNHEDLEGLILWVKISNQQNFLHCWVFEVDFGFQIKKKNLGNIYSSKNNKSWCKFLMTCYLTQVKISYTNSAI